MAMAVVTASVLSLFGQSAPPFSVVEASISQMQKAMAEGRVTSRDIVQQSLTRIALYEDQLNAVITVNRHALEEADARDRERAAGKVRGPLHGIPIALKDNIQTTDMPTTGGALAFAGLDPALRGDCYEAAARGGRHHHRQDADDRAGQLGDGRHARQLQQRHRLRLQPVRSASRPAPGDLRRTPGACHRRVQLRRRHGGQLLGGERRHRNVRLDPQPVEPDDARRHQADGRSCQPLRDHSDHRRSGHGRPDGANSRGRGDPARRDRERIPRSERSGHRYVRTAAPARLHALSGSRRAEGRPHRRTARVLLRTSDGAWCDRCRAAA